MIQIFKLTVSKILFVNFLYVQCHPVTYPAQKMPSEFRYTPFPYRNYSPVDAYEVPSTHTRMYYPGVPYHVGAQRATSNSSFSFSDFINGLNDLDYQHEKPRHYSDHGYSHYVPGLRDSSDTKHEVEHYHGTVEPVSIAKPAEASSVEDKGVSVSFLKPDWSSFTTPATTNMDKWSGLLQLVLSFISGAKSGSLELKGFQDIIINGIVKPILVAKGNIKSFISKITIPLISLLLINIEVLVTVWWLWEDCPKEMKTESTDHSEYNHTSV